MTKFPAITAKLIYNYGAWIVGSAAEPTTDLSSVNDIDIMVPFHLWYLASALIPSTARPNTFGGWKIQDIGHSGIPVMVDIWPDEVGRMILNHKCQVAWHPKSGVRIRKEQ